MTISEYQLLSFFHSLDLHFFQLAHLVWACKVVLMFVFSRSLLIEISFL